MVSQFVCTRVKKFITQNCKQFEKTVNFTIFAAITSFKQLLNTKLLITSSNYISLEVNELRLNIF